jgi:hypothetical protein
MSTSLPVVALSMPVLGFLFSQMIAKKGYAEERPYRILASFFIIFLMMGVFVSVLSFTIFVGFVSSDFLIYVEYAFLATLLSIPGAIIITAILVLRSG